MYAHYIYAKLLKIYLMTKFYRYLGNEIQLILQDIESTSKCKFVAKLGKMFEKDLIWGKEI